MKKIIFFILFCFAITCSAQIVTIKGTIISSSDGLPIANVNISIQGTNYGVSSDKDGKFSLENVKLPVIIHISHIAYISKDISLTKKDITKGNTIELNISLEEKINLISEITIKAKPYNSLERLVYDFEVDDSNLYIISNKRDKKILSVYTFDDIRERMQEIPKKCNEISFDCQKKIRIKNAGREDYWRITALDTSLKYTPYDSILNGISYIIANPKNYVENKYDMFFRWYFSINPTETIPNTLSNVGVNYIGSLNNGVYVSYDMGWWGKLKKLFRIYEEGGELKYKVVYYAFYNIDDWLFSNIKPPYYKHKFNRKLGLLELDNFTIDRLNLIKRSNDILAEYLSRLRIPFSSPSNIFRFYLSLKFNIPVSFITTDKYLYIFNFDKGVFYQLDQDNTLLSSVYIDEVFKEDFSYSEIIFNKEYDKCFIRYEKSSNTTLKEIDLKTGRYIRTIKFPQNKIEKIRIVNNYIYYTAAVEGFNAIERHLFKQKMEDNLTQN